MDAKAKNEAAHNGCDTRLSQCQSSQRHAIQRVLLVVKGDAGMVAVQKRLSGDNNTNPCELQRLMLPPNPFMPSSCDKQLSFFTPLRLRDSTICQGDAFRPSPWHTVAGRGGRGTSQSHPQEEERKKE